MTAPSNAFISLQGVVKTYKTPAGDFYALKGIDIPLSARIVALADVFDALTSIRPYKEAWSIDKALEYVAEESGKHFDPELVAAMLTMRAQLEKIQREHATAIH